MNIKIVNEDKEKLRIRFIGETLTFPNILAKTVQEEGLDAAAVQEHPFLSDPEILVMGANPRGALKKACEKIIEQCDEIKAEVNKKLKE